MIGKAAKKATSLTHWHIDPAIYPLSIAVAGILGFAGYKLTSKAYNRNLKEEIGEYGSQEIRHGATITAKVDNAKVAAGSTPEQSVEILDIKK